MRILIRALAFAASGFALACSNDLSAPRPVALKVVTAPSASAETMVKLPIQPTIQIVDASGNAVALANHLITASVSVGEIYDGWTARTNDNGLATFESLTLGTVDGVLGARVITFSSPGLEDVTAAVFLECASTLITLGVTINGELGAGDCISSNNTSAPYEKHYRVDVQPPTKALRLTHTANYFGYVGVRGPNEPTMYIGIQTDEPLSLKMLVPPGVSYVMESGTQHLMAGSFSLTVDAAPEDEVECEFVMFQSPLDTKQTLRPECVDDNGNSWDWFTFALQNGGKVVASMTSDAFTPEILIVKYNPDGRLVATGNLQGNKSSASYTNDTGESSFFFIVAGAKNGAGTGPYTLTATVNNHPESLSSVVADTQAPASMPITAKEAWSNMSIPLAGVRITKRASR